MSNNFFLEPYEHNGKQNFSIFTKYKNHKRRKVGNILQSNDGESVVYFDSDVFPVCQNEGTTYGDIRWVTRQRRITLRFSNMETAKAVVSDLLSIQII